MTALGVLSCQERALAPGLGGRRTDPYTVLATLGRDLMTAITELVANLDLDNRGLPIVRVDEDEERLARMLLVAAWYALLYRVPFAFADTPLFQAVSADPTTFTLSMMLAIPHRHLVDDVLAQLDLTQDSHLATLRAASTPERCHPGPTFDGSRRVTADADLIVDGLLLDFKSTRRVDNFSQATMQQLLGYALMDFSDRYEIDAVGLFLTRAGALISWPIEEYLRLLGARRRDLGEFRASFAALLAYPGCPADIVPAPEQRADVDRLLAELATRIGAGCCSACGHELDEAPLSRGQARRYCSTHCRSRAPTLRRHGWLAVASAED
ncbi:hypothetical protein FXN61_39600 [Lentzea sp. PSKA42]|uniref:PD-(D/E)XK nuclease superfamily protein n=1 Tax=Lentzea indica TaxID=2604800 RepID=A0ABX1FTX9_9PSEU|nr:hypothetical protein [Lentzea indica]NKE62513.1 hypothetical protein [Lentzea indica]